MHPFSRGASFSKCRRGTAAIEAAIVIPVLLVMMLAGTQLVMYLNAVKKVELVATSLSEMISQASPPSGSTIATVNSTDIHFSYDSALVIFPYLMKDAARQNVAWWQDIYIDFASVQFTQTSTACVGKTDQSPCYLANVVWTSTGTTGPNARACVVPQIAAADNASSSRTTLPKSAFGAGSIIVIDVSFTFRPTFATNMMGPLTISRSVYLQPRYASLINYDTTGSDGIVMKCPGY